MSGLTDIPVKCTRCRHACMESEWLDKPMKSVGPIAMTEKVCPKCGCKSYYDMRPQVAWCWASGLIEIGDAAPASDPVNGGPIIVATGGKSALEGALSATARFGTGASMGQLLVPGVPEAETSEAATDALTAWVNWCAKRNGKPWRNGVVFKVDVS